jgi:acyl-CoA thioesterase I
MTAAAPLADGATVVFVGDSITDAGRTFFAADVAAGELGSGFVRLVASLVGVRHPARGFRFLNAGVSGDRVGDLAARWRRDVLAPRPDLVSVLVGINDTWRRYDADDPTPVEVFAAGYAQLLDMVAEHTDAALVLGEPFLLPVRPELDVWREDLDPKIEVVRGLAVERDAVLVPFDERFRAACELAPPAHWAPDGVHPSPAGHGLMALAWLDATAAAFG